jgi:hypothetical protein
VFASISPYREGIPHSAALSVAPPQPQPAPPAARQWSVSEKQRGEGDTERDDTQVHGSSCENKVYHVTKVDSEVKIIANHRYTSSISNYKSFQDF